MHLTTTCPVCDSTDFSNFLTCSDHTVSHETFQLKRCGSCTLVLTDPRPATDQLGKYYESDNYISHSDSSRSAFDKLYQVSRLLTLRWKTSLLKRHVAQKSSPMLLDYGCGTGAFLKASQSSGFIIQGVEPSAPARAKASDLTKANIVDDVKKINSHFDAITLWHVLEHVEDLNEKIEVLKSLLKKSGTMFIAVPNHNSEDAKHYQHQWAGYDVPRHLWHFNEQSMCLLLKKHELKLSTIIPMKLDSFYVSMLSEKYRCGSQTISTIIQGAWHGLKSNLSAGKNNYSSQIFVVRK